MGEPGRVVVDSEAGCVELRKGSVVELREDDMNCGYCGCLLPDEYHPNCKVCGGPRKAVTKDRYLPPCTWVDYPADAAWMDLAYYSKLTFVKGAEDAGE